MSDDKCVLNLDQYTQKNGPAEIDSRARLHASAHVFEPHKGLRFEMVRWGLGSPAARPVSGHIGNESNLKGLVDISHKVDS